MCKLKPRLCWLCMCWSLLTTDNFYIRICKPVTLCGIQSTVYSNHLPTTHRDQTTSKTWLASQTKHTLHVINQEKTTMEPNKQNFISKRDGVCILRWKRNVSINSSLCWVSKHGINICRFGFQLSLPPHSLIHDTFVWFWKAVIPLFVKNTITSITL